ncbi:MAG: hypothetical protein HY754_15105 [Nitrospirae bacterium]|nr:hypothetical protein [Nitrospirota bacterium]
MTKSNYQKLIGYLLIRRLISYLLILKYLGRLIKETDPKGKIIAYSYDANGNLITKTAPDGVTISYYPFGETRVNNGSATNSKYTGQEEDPETGLYYHWGPPLML